MNEKQKHKLLGADGQPLATSSEDNPSTSVFEKLAKVLQRFTLISGVLELLILASTVAVAFFTYRVADRQNDILEDQKQLMARLGEKRVSLQASNNRTVYLSMMDNILNQVGREIVNPKDRLKKGTINRIGSLAKIMKPYPILIKDSLIEEEYSYERGVLFSALFSNDFLSSNDLQKISDVADFSHMICEQIYVPCLRRKSPSKTSTNDSNLLNNLLDLKVPYSRWDNVVFRCASLSFRGHGINIKNGEFRSCDHLQFIARKNSSIIESNTDFKNFTDYQFLGESPLVLSNVNCLNTSCEVNGMNAELNSFSCNNTSKRMVPSMSEDNALTFNVTNTKLHNSVVVGNLISSNSNLKFIQSNLFDSHVQTLKSRLYFRNSLIANSIFTFDIIQAEANPALSMSASSRFTSKSAGHDFVLKNCFIDSILFEALGLDSSFVGDLTQIKHEVGCNAYVNAENMKKQIKKLDLIYIPFFECIQ